MPESFLRSPHQPPRIRIDAHALAQRRRLGIRWNRREQPDGNTRCPAAHVCYRAVTNLRRVAEHRSHFLIALTCDPQYCPECLASKIAAQLNDEPKHTSAPWRRFIILTPFYEALRPLYRDRKSV